MTMVAIMRWLWLLPWDNYGCSYGCCYGCYYGCCYDCCYGCCHEMTMVANEIDGGQKN